MTSRYMVMQMKAKEEMDAIMNVIWAANYNPYDTYAQLFFPVLGFTSADREAALAESKERFWNNHVSTPSSNWFYVMDVATGHVVGCAQWEIHTENPFKAGVPALRAPWWPEGDYRDFCEEILRQAYKSRANWMRRPHLGKLVFHPGSAFLTENYSTQLDGRRSRISSSGGWFSPHAGRCITSRLSRR